MTSEATNDLNTQPYCPYCAAELRTDGKRGWCCGTRPKGKGWGEGCRVSLTCKGRRERMLKPVMEGVLQPGSILPDPLRVPAVVEQEEPRARARPKLDCPECGSPRVKSQRGFVSWSCGSWRRSGRPGTFTRAVGCYEIVAERAIEATKGVGDVNSTTPGSGARYNAGKPDFSLLPMFTLQDELAVWAYGAKKYAPWNWTKGMPWSIPFACAMRHLTAWQMGEELDAESGLPHLAHAMCNLRMLTLYASRYREGDDRPAHLREAAP